MSEERGKGRVSDKYKQVVLDVSIVINESDYYSISESKELFEIGIKMLSLTDDCFEIDIQVKGVLKEYFIRTSDDEEIERYLIDSDSIWQGSGLYDKLLSFKRKESFTYKQTVIYPDAGVINCKKIENGKDFTLSDLLELASPEILITHPKDSWIAWNPCMRMTFDRERFSKQFEMIEEAAKRHLPPHQLKYCEREWLEEEEDILLDFPQRIDNLQSLQDYLDEINATLYEFEDLDDFDFFMGSSVMGEDYPYVLWVSEKSFAIASVNWINDELKVTGREF